MEICGIEEAKKKLLEPKKIPLVEIIRKFKREGIENFVITRPEIVETLLTAYEKEKEKNKKINKYIEDRAKIGKDIQTFINKDYVEQEYISKEKAEQKERKAYIKGTNDAHELCDKKWKNKIKAKIEEIDFMIKEINQGHLQKYTVGELLGAKRFLESLLEKE